MLEVLINLADNAIKFTARWRSHAASNYVDADPGSAYISVSDTGRGIGPEAKALIFERLYQDPNSVDDNRSGLGLGLFISREIVRLHQGRIWVSSEPGQGSTFTFTLPIFSLAKLLAPVVIHQAHCVRIWCWCASNWRPVQPSAGKLERDLAASLETVRRCIYLDKDLLLPPMGAAGSAEISTWSPAPIFSVPGS